MVENIQETVKVCLYIKCKGLKDVEVFSKSDPFVEVFERTNETDWNKIGQTEVIWDNLNPEFTKSFELDYYFEVQIYLKFSVFDANMENLKEIKGKLLGEAETTLSEIIGMKGHSIVKNLRIPKQKNYGTIILRIEEISNINNDTTQIKFIGEDLKNIFSCFCLPRLRPMLYLEREIEGQESQKIYCPEHLYGPDPEWKEVKIPIQVLCNGNFNFPISFSLYNFNYSGSHKYVGGFNFSISEISQNSSRTFSLTNLKSTKKPSGT